MAPPPLPPSGLRNEVNGVGGKLKKSGTDMYMHNNTGNISSKVNDKTLLRRVSTAGVASNGGQNSNTGGEGNFDMGSNKSVWGAIVKSFKTLRYSRSTSFLRSSPITADKSFYRRRKSTKDMSSIPGNRVGKPSATPLPPHEKLLLPIPIRRTITDGPRGPVISAVNSKRPDVYVTYNLGLTPAAAASILHGGVGVRWSLGGGGGVGDIEGSTMTTASDVDGTQREFL